MGHDNWRTPKPFFDAVDDEFSFPMDAAASQENSLCPRFMGVEQDALKTEWGAYDCWCNPPYSLIGPFVQRAHEQSERYHTTNVVLIPAYTDPKYWSDYVMRAHEVRFLKGRLSFLDEDGMKKTSARFPSVLVVFRWIRGVHHGKAPQQWVWDWRQA